MLLRMLVTMQISQAFVGWAVALYILYMIWVFAGDEWHQRGRPKPQLDGQSFKALLTRIASRGAISDAVAGRHARSAARRSAVRRSVVQFSVEGWGAAQCGSVWCIVLQPIAAQRGAVQAVGWGAAQGSQHCAARSSPVQSCAARRSTVQCDSGAVAGTGFDSAL